MVLKALIVDDEPLAHEVILDYLAEVDFIEVAGRCFHAAEALNFLARTPVDLLFLDINMPKLKGTDFLKILANPPLTIVTSAHAEYALQGFELDVCDYLLKPFRFDRFLQAVNKARKRYGEPGQGEVQAVVAGTTEPETTDQRIFLKVDKKQVLLDLTEILYLEAYGNYVKVWVGDRYLLTPRTLTSFETQLNPSQFQRIHKSYMVQVRHIRYIEGSTLVMVNGETLPVGKSYKKHIKHLDPS